MAVFKCKMCGGNLKVEEGMTICECEYCRSVQTVPTLDDEKKIKLFERANKLRLACDFDRASSVYESIIVDFPNDAEAYWGICLCEYGIEYVDDPTSGKKIPTCHRSSFESIFDSDMFDMVMENSDPKSRSIYRAEAKTIEEIRKGIIEISGKEAPYDIFICYKETDEFGNRTIDSVIAQDVYYELTQKGYRVFFSRISLENVLGVEYEPFIFAALNSAKIMLVFGTSYEYYNAVWVKNEWSRFLKIMTKERDRYLIPCYRDIDAYDIPKEFSKIQAQDMGKIGAIQDLIRGIEKIYPKNVSESQKDIMQVVQTTEGHSVKSLMQRAQDELEDKEWKKALDYFDEVLNIDAQNARAYLGCAMAEYHCSSLTEFKEKYIECDEESVWFRRAYKYADADLMIELKSIYVKKEEVVKERKQQEERKRLSIKTFFDKCPDQGRIISIYDYLEKHKHEYLGNMTKYEEMLKQVYELAYIEKIYGFSQKRLEKVTNLIMNLD